MARRRSGTPTSPMETSGNGAALVRPSHPRHPPNYNSNIVQEALENLASIDLMELCNEAKIERCRATRDLSSCGRYVQHVLNSCGHASLCAECIQRYDVCPICRTSIPSNDSRFRLRLYYKCIEAGLISKRNDDRFQEKEDTGEFLTADIQRLYSLFDVALENNLVSLVCHYVTDVCMDETAVSSDPILAFLLDEVVVKDWCKRAFKSIIHDLHGIYNRGVEAMTSNLSLFQKLASQLSGISNVLEVMDSSFKGTSSAQLHDLHYLLENILKTKQHLEVIIWCARHQFLENIQPRYTDLASWTINVHERKSSALDRAWPEVASSMTDAAGHRGCTLFIEQALSYLGIEQSYMEKNEEVDIFCLRDEDSPLMFQSLIDVADKNVAVGCYPFGTLRAATDVLFLYGTSDMVVAKQAIFLYYLFDRHWTKPDSEWRYLVDDFAASFDLNRLLILESLVFYLLDDHTDQSLQDARYLLPEIASPETHQKVAQVLLERHRPDVALTVLRCTGRDGFCDYGNSEHDDMQCVSLLEAVTAVRVRIECGLLTEAFMYQRMHCSKVKKRKFKPVSSTEVFNRLNSDSWSQQIEVLVTEICYLCIRRNLVDRMIELPWDSDEEKYLHKCLLDHASQDPSTVYGSLLVVFYLQRYRYKEAYQVDRKLLSLDPEAADVNLTSKMRSISQWRARLVDKSLKLLPEAERRQIMTGDMTDNDVLSSQNVQNSVSEFANVSPNPATLETPSAIQSSLVLQQTDFRSHTSPNGSTESTPNGISSISITNLKSGNKVPSILQRRLLALRTPTTRMGNVAEGISSLNSHDTDKSALDVNMERDFRREDVRQGLQSAGFLQSPDYHSRSWNTPLKELNRSGLRVGQINYQFRVGKSSYKMEFDITNQTENFRPSATRADPEDNGDFMDTSNGFLHESDHDQSLTVLGEQNLVDRRSWHEETNPQNFGGSNSPALDTSTKVGSRWRLDESSEEEVDVPGSIHTGSITAATRRRARFSRRARSSRR